MICPEKMGSMGLKNASTRMVFLMSTPTVDAIGSILQGYNRVCESTQRFVFDRSKCSVCIKYTSVWSRCNLQADAAFITKISCTSKMLEVFKNDRILVKTGLAWCPEASQHCSAALYAINRHSNICTRAYQGLSQVAPKYKNMILCCNWL